MAFELPALPYPRAALEPHVSARTMEFHHSKHHAAYVETLNKLIEGTEFEKMRLEEIIQVRFSGRGRKTTLKVHAIASGLSDEAVPMLKGMKQGWSQTVARLNDHLKER